MISPRLLAIACDFWLQVNKAYEKIVRQMGEIIGKVGKDFFRGGMHGLRPVPFDALWLRWHPFHDEAMERMGTRIS